MFGMIVYPLEKKNESGLLTVNSNFQRGKHAESVSFSEDTGR
jgi:hypothetical protein